VERRFRDGHTETWWAVDLELAGYRPGGYTRLVAATTDPVTLPAVSTWYVVTNLPHPNIARAAASARASGPGRDCAPLRAAAVGGAGLSSGERGAGLGRLPGPLRPRHPAALAPRLLRLLILLVGLPPPAGYHHGRSDAQDGPRPNRGGGGAFVGRCRREGW